MPFMVIYRALDGTSCYEQADAIDEAALLVERLRNKEGLDEIRIYRMEEISFAFRPYYKVELGLTERQGPRPAPASAVDIVDEPIPEPEGTVSTDIEADATVEDQPEVATAMALPAPPPPSSDDDSAGANGRRGLFGR